MRRTLNSFEDRLQSAVAGLPQGQRVISAIDDPSLRVFAVEHMIDRVCVGHCFSYGKLRAIHRTIPRARYRGESVRGIRLSGCLVAEARTLCK